MFDDNFRKYSVIVVVFFMCFLKLSESKAVQWKVWKHVNPENQTYTFLDDSLAEFETNGVKCEIGKELTIGKGKSRWSMRTMTCIKGDAEVSVDVACGAGHGKTNSGGFTFKSSKDAKPIKPVLICE